MSITPSNEQNSAIKKVVEWYNDPNKQVFYLAGYAGVGKSSIAELALEEIKSKHKNVTNTPTAAYTGKAASVLRNKGVANTTTIHSLIYTPIVNEKGELEGFKIDEDSQAHHADIILLDECSMINDTMADDLKSFGKKILVMGDPGQLPPISGQGAFTRNDPDVFLKEVHRQAAESPIIMLATLARQGKPLPVRFDEGGVKTLKLNMESGELIHSKDTDQVICGLNKTRFNVTQRMRKNLGFDSEKVQPGERIICCKNNKMIGIFNGLMGEFLSKSRSRHKGLYDYTVKLDDRTYKDLITDEYLFDRHFTNGNTPKAENDFNIYPNEFDWAYAITCHKAQGSQWGHITIIDDSSSFRDTKNQWLYTALTRAESGLTLLMR